MSMKSKRLLFIVILAVWGLGGLVATVGYVATSQVVRRRRVAPRSG